ncbi:hypothetical protein STEG23_016233 [Scotinomys teguina]
MGSPLSSRHVGFYHRTMHTEVSKPAQHTPYMELLLSRSARHREGGRRKPAPSLRCGILSAPYSRAVQLRSIRFVYMVYYIDRLSYVEPSLHRWDEAYLVNLGKARSTMQCTMWLGDDSVYCGRNPHSKTSSTILNRCGEGEQPCLVYDFSGFALSFSPLKLILAVALL